MATVAAWWRRWTEPAADVADPVDRRQARLLAGVVLFILALGSTSIVLQLILTPDFWPVFLVVLGAMVVLLGGYHLARRGRYAAGTLVTCTVACRRRLRGNGGRTPESAGLRLPDCTYHPRLPAVARTNGGIHYRRAILGGAVLLLVLVRDQGATGAAHMGALDGGHPAGQPWYTFRIRQRNLVERDRRSRLADSEQNLRALADNADDGILITFQTRHVVRQSGRGPHAGLHGRGALPDQRGRPAPSRPTGVGDRPPAPPAGRRGLAQPL